jgi:beta-lactamase regulating signal transducer with metallopeptidase domain
MTTINEMLQQPFARAVGWTLLQFVWQGTLIALVTGVVLAALRRSGPDVRYVVATIALALMLTTPIVTVVQTLASVPAVPPAATNARRSSAAGLEAHEPTASPLSSAETAPPRIADVTAPSFSIEAWLPSLVSVWLGGVALLTLRLFSGWMWVRRLRSHGTRPASAHLQNALRRLTRQLHITRAVRLVESSRVAVPTVIGWLKPIVLLPASAIAGLSPDQLEAILAHELAHVRRHDYVVNLLQTVVETLLFYHPAVWWLSRRIRTERENCCDDLAVSLCGDPVAYAAALAELEGLRSSSAPLVLAASGGSLLQRVRRLLGVPTHAGRAPGWLAAGAALLVLSAMSAGVGARDSLAGESQGLPTPPTPPAPAVSASPVTAGQRASAMPSPPGGQAAPAAPAAPEPAAVPSVAPAAAVAAAAAREAQPAVPESVMATPVVPAAATPAAAPIAAGTAVAVFEPPAVPAVAQPAQSSSRSEDQSGNWVWSENGRKVEVSYRGEIEFTDDDTDVKRLSPGGHLRIKDGGRFSTDNTVEFRADGSGSIERRFWAGGRERPFEPDGRTWLAQMLPKFIRQSGIGAPARVARIMKSGGAAAVLSEISQIEGSFARRVYFTELVKQPGLASTTIQQALAQAGREIESDFELASLLIGANRLVTDDDARKAYLDAAKTIQSDFELHRVLSSLAKAGPMTPAIAASVLETSGSIDSDFELASFLLEFLKTGGVERSVRAPFFRALTTVASDFERGRVLQALARRTDISDDTVLEILRSTQAMGGHFEKSQVLLAVASSHPLSGAGREAYIEAAEKLGDFEQGRALAALVKNERRK